MKQKIKNYIRVRLGFFKNIIPQTMRYFSAYFESVTYDKVMIRDVLLLSHALEKGLIYSNPKSSWGIIKANDLIFKITYLLNNGFDPKAYEIQEACSVLKAYSESKGKNGRDIMIKLNSLMTAYSIDLIPGGSLSISKQHLFFHNNSSDFITSRRSIRFFDDGIVPKDIILRAISIANTTPSACNKQPCNVYCPFNQQSIDAIGKYFSKAYVFERTPQILIVTSKLSFFSSDEYLQPLVNGGMYATTLCLAFHSLGIGSCPLEMVAFKKPEKEIRRICNIAVDEIIVTAITFGYVKETNQCTCGARRQNYQVLKEF
ncbi:nitroreductase family protein [Bacteroides pyogenes]|uniref:nitroreductase family protein n=1 Tax=Bacteroides pyogenes TaxID=310300 RepID=UPI001BA52796|nr:nitroreductase family protein [Bacteroides pyogenes]MBR8704742.1 hypothetical protein [Bacteroides pyogenes]